MKVHSFGIVYLFSVITRDAERRWCRHRYTTESYVLDLLKSELYLQLYSRPWELEPIIDAMLSTRKADIIVIDEIQKVPALLDEIHRLIESRHFRFLLTGSSARKLKYGHANLLAGRAWTAHLYPLSYSEIPQFDLDIQIKLRNFTVTERIEVCRPSTTCE